MVLYTSVVSFNNEKTHNELMADGYRYEVHYGEHTGHFGRDWKDSCGPDVEYLNHKVAFCDTEEEAKAVKAAKEALEEVAYVDEVAPLVHKMTEEERIAAREAEKRAKDEAAAKKNNMSYEEYVAYKKKKNAKARYEREMRKIKEQMEALEAKYAEYEAKLNDLTRG